MSVDPTFPRVFQYEVGAGKVIPAARAGREARIELNGDIFSSGDYRVTCSTTGDAAVDYSVTIERLALVLGFRLEARSDELRFDLTSVEEKGAFRLVSLDFPDQHLIRIPAGIAGAAIYRSEYSRRPWKDAEYRAGYDQPKAFFSSDIGDEDGELDPKLGNWASGSMNGVTATVASNIPYWKIRTQFLGYDARATDFTISLGTYLYRLRGNIQPLLEARVALLTRDANGDGRIDWMEAALWHHDLLRDPAPVFDPSRGFSYKVMNDWLDQPGNEPATTFEETLDLIERISRITGNVKQVVALTGWQNRGHDSGWPYFSKVNDALGGIDKLRWLARESARYDATISYHINLDDSNENTPGFERSIPVLAFGRDGKPYPWSVYFTGGPQVYRVSHTKDLESGFFEQRVTDMLKLVPKTNSIQLDTFRPFDISFGPGEDIGVVDEVVASERIVKWFQARGIAVSSEGPVDALYGVLDGTYHLFVRTDPFHILMTHGKLFGGGKYSKGAGQVLGWAPNHDFVVRPIEWNEPRFDIHMRWEPITDDELRDAYYLGTLTQGYLVKKRLVWLGEDPESDAKQPGYVGRFADGTVSKVSSSGYWTVIEDGVTTVDGDYRAIPRGDSTIVLYSVAGRRADVRVPATWRDRKLVLTEVESKRTSIVRPAGASAVAVELRPRVAYLLKAER